MVRGQECFSVGGYYTDDLTKTTTTLIRTGEKPRSCVTRLEKWTKRVCLFSNERDWLNKNKPKNKKISRPKTPTTDLPGSKRFFTVRHAAGRALPRSRHEQDGHAGGAHVKKRARAGRGVPSRQNDLFGQREHGARGLLAGRYDFAGGQDETVAAVVPQFDRERVLDVRHRFHPVDRRSCARETVTAVTGLRLKNRTKKKKKTSKLFYRRDRTRCGRYGPGKPRNRRNDAKKENPDLVFSTIRTKTTRWRNFIRAESGEFRVSRSTLPGAEVFPEVSLSSVGS